MANEKGGKKSPLSKAADYDRNNLASAKLILADPDRHGGADAFPALWARLVMARLEGGPLVQ